MVQGPSFGREGVGLRVSAQLSSGGISTSKLIADVGISSMSYEVVNPPQVLIII